MKKLIIILLSLFILFSCSKKENLINENSSWSLNELVEQTWSLVEETFSVELVEESTKNELMEITHNNFKPLITSLEKMENESLKNIDCDTYIYMTELDKRPDYQVEIYNDYKKQCNDLVESAKK